MDISGKIIAVLPIQTGEGRNGTWRSQDYVLETKDQYPKKICFNLFGGKIEQFPITLNDEVKVSFDIESREWNGRWFTTVRAWKVEKNQEHQSAPDAQGFTTQTAPFPTTPPVFEESATGEGNDLPF